MQGWDGLFSQVKQQMGARVRDTLAVAGIDVGGIHGLDEVFQDTPSPFEGLETRYLQEKYFCEELGLVVSLASQAQNNFEVYSMLGISCSILSQMVHIEAM